MRLMVVVVVNTRRGLTVGQLSEKFIVSSVTEVVEGRQVISAGH